MNMVSCLLGLLLVVSVSVKDAKSEIRVPPTILSPREGQTLIYKQYQKVTVYCNATGTPKPKYKWKWNGAEINSQHIKYNETDGHLDIPSLSERDEGIFVCLATSTFSKEEKAVALSPLVEIRVARVGDFIKRPTEYYNVKEGMYIKLPCDKELPAYYGATTFKWYKTYDQKNTEIFMDARKFIDQEGSLHFSYAQTDDQSARDEKYKCAMSNVDSSVIKLGNENSLQVNSNGSSIPDSSPHVQYTTSGKLLTVEVGKNATLECVFSGYKAGGSNNKTVPVITWLDQLQQPIGDGGRYQITHEGRSLIIMNVTEEDEKTYHCQGTNLLGSAIGNLTLNVTSRPIWVQRVPSVTLTEGKDAELTCVTRSASNEAKPNAPIWLRNGESMTSGYDPSKYVFNPDKTILTIKHVKKDRDIACYQCEVANSVGMVQDDGCVNVVVPISISVKPNEIQRVKKEDVVELTVVATTDPLYESEMRYSWIFKNVTYEGSNAPPNVTYDAVSKRAYINTSVLTDEELKKIVGIYRRVITTPVETKHIDVEVKLEAKKTEPVVNEAGFDFWLIILAVGIFIVLIVLIVTIYSSCRRKQQEGTYPVDKKETAAGLDPEKELMNSRFHDII
ncbi:contactin-5-like [Pomacea canaliculata]|uniref:contactin-5-like n=1 Tax=Pomacea canaliculata TaxID=400727 RepID=UPI000D72C92D|nr:contactin-5-like [Pomacea canaliculata]XP_025089094.1 contactin-5-like [Pomacea canaliculata]XP_025089095.1 contactin-5-like [Pomacea canaliculata]XP_025089096.1 contactin-5-like [Pomacea canaliculata]XP_025089097.1 contactin-5-like [Pomacea canaliculata]